MIEIGLTVLVNAPMEDVFSIYTDPYRGLKFVPGLIRVERKATTASTTEDVYLNVYEYRGGEYVLETSYQELIPNQKLVVRASDPRCEALYVMTFLEKDGNCEVNIHASVKPKQLSFRVLEPRFAMFYKDAQIARQMLILKELHGTEAKPSDVRITTFRAWRMPVILADALLWGVVAALAVFFFRWKDIVS